MFHIKDIGLRNKLKWFLFLSLYLFILILKFHNYDRVPYPIHAEEQHFAWSGINLIETGAPISWSTLDYPKENLIFDGIVGDKNNIYLPAKLYKPCLDEPPLYSLLSGGMAHLFGDNRNLVIPASHLRIPSVLASVMTTILVFLVGYKLFNFNVGLLSMCLYGMTPIIAFGSRLSVPENMTALAVVLSLLLINKYLKNPKIYISLIVGLLTIILGLMKPTGFFIAPLFIYFAFIKKKWRDIFIIIISLIIGIIIYIAYGYSYGWELFKHIVSIQGGRFAGWTGLAYILSSPAFDINLLFDGWYIFSLFFALFFSFKNNSNKNIKLLSIVFFYWLLVAIFSGTEQDLLPWYRYPIFPLLSIFGALGLNWVYKKSDFFTLAFSIGLLLSSRYYLSNDFRPTTPTLTFRLLFFIFLVPSLLYIARKYIWAKKLSGYLFIVVVVVGLFLNSKYIYSAFEINCENKICPFGESTLLSKTKLPIFDKFLLPKYPTTDMLTTKRPWF